MQEPRLQAFGVEGDGLLLVLLRHGEYSKGETHLNAEGHQQIETVSRLLVFLLRDRAVRIMHTNGPRATETAKILGGVFRQTTEDIGPQIGLRSADDIPPLFGKGFRAVVVVSNGKELGRAAALIASDYQVRNPVRKRIRKGPVHALIVAPNDRSVDEIVVR